MNILKDKIAQVKYVKIVYYDWPPDKVMQKLIFTENEAVVAMIT